MSNIDIVGICCSFSKRMLEVLKYFLICFIILEFLVWMILWYFCLYFNSIYLEVRLYVFMVYNLKLINV